ncbi:MAG: hypothetical protein JW715_11520 [Sedimentisphaerales bacterium]|nr:hypothetical protein [Sedimentisphaerales bacterium]
MKKYQFLLLDAGPIIKLFELGIWEQFIKACDVTITRTVAENEVVFASKGDDKEYIDLMPYEQDGKIKIVDIESSDVTSFYNKFDLTYQAIIDPGENETLTFMLSSDEKWLVCAADHVVFRILGLLGMSEQGVSLEEVLKNIGLSSHQLEWQYTKKFREKYTNLGRLDSIQDRGLN